MVNPNTQNPNEETSPGLMSPKEKTEHRAKESRIYGEAHKAAKGSYEEKGKAGRKSVLEYRHEVVEERYAADSRKMIGQTVAEAAPAPESGEVSPDLTKLSQEQVSAWLENNKGNLAEALTTMFNLEHRRRMRDDELALFMHELKDPEHIKQRTFFTLTEWLNRVRRDGQETAVDEASVIDTLLFSIAKNQPPSGLKAA